MEKEIQSFSYQIDQNIAAGNLATGNSPSIGGVQGKFKIVSIVLSSQAIDSVTLGFVDILTRVRISTLNTTSYYSIMFPNGVTSWQPTLNFTFTNAFKADTYFIIQPGDNLRFITSVYLKSAAANITNCSTYVLLNGYAID